MRKRSRTRVRTRGKVVLTPYTRMVALFHYAQHSNKWREWAFRTVSQRQAESLVSMGEAAPLMRFHDGAVRLVGYVATTPVRMDRPSPTTLTFGTLCAVSNQDALGQDVAPRFQLTRREKREIVKFRVWPLIGDTKAVAVRPRISEDERRFAEKLLAASYPEDALSHGVRSVA